tara:strand:+ start:949 stop:1197 length:249 start_codon:yes stop_codon:yes gene_type:complete
MINTWIQFEHDICTNCNAPKYGKITDLVQKDTLTLIVSCDCDTAVFKDEWKRVEPADLIVVLDPNGVENTLRAMAHFVSGGK